jgi:hypothetical protein
VSEKQRFFLLQRWERTKGSMPFNWPPHTNEGRETAFTKDLRTPRFMQRFYLRNPLLVEYNLSGIQAAAGKTRMAAEQQALERKQESVESRSIASGDSSAFKEAYDSPRMSAGAKPPSEQQIMSQYPAGAADKVLNGVLAKGVQETPKLYGSEHHVEAPQPSRIKSPPMMEMVAPAVGRHDGHVDAKSAEAPHTAMKPLVGSAEVTERKAQEIPMVAPVMAARAEARENQEKPAESPKLEVKAEALLWDKWNKTTFDELRKDVKLNLQKDHPDLEVPEEYKNVATDVPHLQSKFDVTVQADGTISNIEAIKPSGSAYFDNQVKRGIEHMGSSGKLAFPEESHLNSRVLHVSYGWNWKGGQGYPTGQIEQDGKLQQTH